MVRAWYMDSSSDDQRLPHMRNPPEFVDIDKLREKTNVLYFQMEIENYEMNPKYKTLLDERGYNCAEVVEVSREKLPNYDEKLKHFFTEHLHSDEEVRLFLDGSGYFDVRDINDEWIRIECVKGDLIILPEGIYHRFSLDTNDFAKAVRLAIDVPVSIHFSRPADDHPSRLDYLKTLKAC